SAWETDDSMQIHINGVDDVYSKTEVDLDNASHTLSATLDDEGKLKVEIFNNTDSTGDDTEWLEIDNFQIVGGNSYEYQVDLSASLTDSTETLNDIIIADLPVGISFEDSARNPITVNADGTFTIAIPDDGGTPTVWMISTKEMTNADIDALTASVTSVSAGGDMATAEATPTRFSAPIVTQGDTEVLEEASEVIATITDSDGSLDHASFSYTTDNGGTVVLEANGDLTYTSARNYSGNDTVHLTISDNEGRTTTHDIAVSISGVADTPTLYMGIDEGVLIPELPFGDTDNFTGGASNEWTGDNVTFANEEMEIEEGYNTALKMFDFGILSANQTVTIEFVTDIKANKWDGGSDNFRVYNNGTEIYQDGMTSALTEDADLDNYITHTFTTTLNASGEAEIEFYTDSRGSDEFVRIDNFSITGVQPEYYEYTLSINAGVTDSNETLSNMLLANLPNDVIVEDSNGEITPLSGEYALTMDTNGDSIVTIKSLDQLSTTEMNSISASVTSNDSGDTISTNVTIGDNDTIVYDGTAALDTGDGFDTIVLATGVDLGTGGIDFSNLDNIEKIDLSDNGAHTVIDITLADVMDMTDPGRVLTIDGIGGEDEVTVNTTDFTLTGTSDGYNTYEGTSGSDSVTLKVEENIDSTGL
ncbi:MAG: Ig-like domain-containing protein, partial [Campylobacterota bacterium]|nr:Ig-like domain-containing protein [Campylobacterota bacterium]